MRGEESSDDDDEEYEYHAAGEHGDEDARFPIHDCCEHDDVETLKDLIYISLDDEDDDESAEDEGNHTVSGENGTDVKRCKSAQTAVHADENQSTSDDNDSTAAAHAAAIGHSPQPIRPSLVDDNNMPKISVVDSFEEGKRDGEEKVNLPSDSDVVKTNPSVVSSDHEAKMSSSAALKDEGEMALMDESPRPLSGQDMMVIDKGESIGDEKINGKVVSERKVRKLVLDRSLNLNERDEDENTALHIAIHSRKLEHVKVLLEAGASSRIRCDGSLPVHVAISIGSLRTHRQFSYECLVALHEHGADLTVKDDAVHTPLYLACMFNHPQVVTYILSDEEGLSTLNTRADRAGNRPLHAAAKFDTLENPSVSKAAASLATGQTQPVASLFNACSTAGYEATVSHAITGVSGKHRPFDSSAEQAAVPSEGLIPSTDALLTQVLLGTSGIEVDALNVLGQTPLHVACMRRNWPVARLLLQAGANPRLTDRRGHTPGHLAHKRAMPIPNDLYIILGDPPDSGIVPPTRELIVDPDGSTLLLHHELCLLHRTCPPIARDSDEPPPENVRRLQVLVDPETGILRSGEFSNLIWRNEARRAAIADVLKVHEYSYVERVSLVTQSIPDHPNAIAHLDGDTAISRWSFEAALRAAGALCEAVDRVVAGDSIRNAFCAVRPPGHHAGPRGIVRCANDPEGGSHGFCLLNNVCIGAAYARSMYRNDGIRKVAIIDFDVHHGNGTEAIIRNLVPSIEKGVIRTPFALGEISSSTFRPWLDETDIQNVFFASTHGYGNRGFDQPGWFYPASGKTHTSEAITHPDMVEFPSTADFLLSQTWTRMGEESKLNCCKIINVGLDLPEPEADQQARNMRQRLELRDTYRKTIFPALRDFDPDLIFISAGFDAHRKDTMNFGYVGMVEDDYEWVTEQIVKIANTCCNGRVISVLEGGYKIHGGIVSPFARSVASHVRALVDGGRSRELYDAEGVEWESQFERHLFERRERKKEQEREELNRLAEDAKRTSRLLQVLDEEGGTPDDPDAPSRKRRRNPVNYKELFKQMQQEGFAA